MDNIGQDDDGSKSPQQKPQAMAAPPPMLNVSDFVVHHTWAIIGLSPFVVPLDLRNGCSSLEVGMTLFLRNHRVTLVAVTPQENGGGDESNQKEDDGTYVRIFHGTLQEPTELAADKTYNDGEETESEHPPIGKRRKIYDNQQGNNMTNRQLHFIIDIRTHDEPSAQLVCCFPTFIQDDSNSAGTTGRGKIQSFDYLLTRGSQSSIGAALGWFETFTGCTIAKSPFRPTVVDVAQAMALWTSEYSRLLKDSKDVADKSGNNHAVDSDDGEEKCKPLTLTYAVPSEFAGSGLDTVSLTVPPIALMRLCNDILQAKGKGNNSDLTAQNTDEDGHVTPSKVDTLPIVKGLQCFMRETFRINIETFSLVHGSCVAAVLGCDGRCKPLCAKLLGSVLREVQFMVQTKTSCQREKGNKAYTGD